MARDHEDSWAAELSGDAALHRAHSDEVPPWLERLPIHSQIPVRVERAFVEFTERDPAHRFQRVRLFAENRGRAHDALTTRIPSGVIDGSNCVWPPATSNAVNRSALTPVARSTTMMRFVPTE